jgi:hypothetical protein
MFCVWFFLLIVASLLFCAKLDDLRGLRNNGLRRILTTLSSLEKTVTEAFIDRISELFEEGEDFDVNNVMDEVVEMHVPLFTKSMLELAISYPPLAEKKADGRPAYNIDTPVNHIIMNVYNRLFEIMY